MPNRVPQGLDVLTLNKYKETDNQVHNELVPERKPQRPLLHSRCAKKLEHHDACCHSTKCWRHNALVSVSLETSYKA